MIGAHCVCGAGRVGAAVDVDVALAPLVTRAAVLWGPNAVWGDRRPSREVFLCKGKEDEDSRRVILAGVGRGGGRGGGL